MKDTFKIIFYRAYIYALCFLGLRILKFKTKPFYVLVQSLSICFSIMKSMCDTLLYFSSHKNAVHSPLLVSHQSCSQKLGGGEQTISESSQSGEGSPGMSLVSDCHVTPILLLIGQFRITWAWRENFFRRISDK
jgi:hypothetical protein